VHADPLGQGLLDEPALLAQSGQVLQEIQWRRFLHLHWVKERNADGNAEPIAESDAEEVHAERTYHQRMAQVHMSEAEVVKDIQAVLEKVRQGTEVIVEQDDRTVAIIKPVKGPGRPIDDCIALAKAHGSGATLDEDFAKDLEEIIASRQPLDTSVWE
jgi:antitoxin (DNA-binding transcriptional repressor) of toxin-antitoxin stability system